MEKDEAPYRSLKTKPWYITFTVRKVTDLKMEKFFLQSETRPASYSMNVYSK